MEPFRHRLLLIKADDFARGRNFQNWLRLFAICQARRVVPSVGVVAADLRNQPKAELDLVRGLQDAGLIELWNHSWMHPDYRTLGPEHIRDEVTRSQEGMLAAFGRRPKLFGYPFNFHNAATQAAVDGCGSFDIQFFAPSGRAEVTVIPPESLVEPEAGTQARQPFRDDPRLERALGVHPSQLVTMQMHPHYWCERSFRAFEAVLDRLLAAGFIPVTGQEYADYASTAPEAVSLPSRGLAARGDERRAAFGTALAPAAGLGPGGGAAAAAWDVLRLAGLDTSTRLADNPQWERGVAFGEVGSLAHAYLLFQGHRQVICVGRDAEHEAAMEREFSCLPELAGRFACHSSADGTTGLAECSVDHVISDHLFYQDDPEGLLGEVARILDFSRLLFLLLRRPSWPLHALQGAVAAGDWALAREMVERLGRAAAWRAGVYRPGGFVLHHDDARVHANLGLVGLRIVLRDIDLAGPAYRGEALLGGYLVQKTRAGLALGTALQDAPELSLQQAQQLWAGGFFRTLIRGALHDPGLLAVPAIAWRCLLAARMRPELEAARAALLDAGAAPELDQAIIDMLAGATDPARRVAESVPGMEPMLDHLVPPDPAAPERIEAGDLLRAEVLAWLQAQVAGEAQGALLAALA